MIRWIGRLLAPALVTATSPAFAHSPIEGIDSFYGGLLHPVFVPGHFLLLLALGLYLGQRGDRNNSIPLAAFVAATLTGFVLAWFEIGSNLDVLILGLCGLIGLLIAASFGVGVIFSVVIAVACGLLLGMDSTQETLTGKEKFVAFFGNGIAFYFLILYPIAIAEWTNGRTWQKIGVRVAGSWIAAAALMVLALTLYGKP